MMTERQRRFREQYVAEISPWYNGLLHIGVTYGVGIAAIVWCVSRMQNATWEWLLLVPVAIAGNFVEWGMHQYVMHRLMDVFAHARDLRPAHPPAPPVLHRQRPHDPHGEGVPHRLLPVAPARRARRRSAACLGWLAAQRAGTRMPATSCSSP